MTVLHALLAGLIGTVFMTLSSTTEMYVRERPESTAPGKGFAFFLKFVGIRVPQEGRAMNILSTWVHWTYGVLWGLLWWLLVVQLELSLWIAAPALGAIVWGFAALFTMPIAGIAPLPWKWGGFKWVLLDWWHHAAYVGGVVIGWVLIEQLIFNA